MPSSITRVQVLTAAAIVAFHIHSEPGIDDLVSVILRVVEPGNRSFVLHIRISSQTRLDTLPHLLEAATEEPYDEGVLSMLTVVFVPDLGSYSDTRLLINELGLCIDSSVIVLLTASHEALVVNRPVTFSTQPETWAAERLAHTLDILQQLPGNIPLHQVQITSAAERDLLAIWSKSSSSDQSVEYKNHPVIHHFFEAVARAHPNYIAIQWASTVITYGKLEKESNALAAYLVQELHVLPGDVILEFFDKSVEMITSMLGIVRSPLSLNILYFR